MRRGWLRWVAALLALTLVAAACGGDDDEAGAPDDATTTAVDDGEDGDTQAAACDETVPGTQIDWGVFAPTSQLDPPYASGALVGGTELIALYDVLMRFDPETNSYEPHLAKSLTANDDHTVWTLKLREGITYSDGTPLTAQLVSDNMDRFFAEDVRNTSGGFMSTITDKTVVDETTLEITLETSWPEFPFVFADEPGMIVNLNAIGENREEFGANPPPAAGLGPYVVERNAPGEELVLKARDDYWGGPVCVETLRFVWIPGSQPTYDAFQAGDLDVAFLRNPVTIEQAREAGEEGFFVQQDAGAVILLNHAEGRPGNDPRVREAAILALDEQGINERAYQGALATSKTLIQPGSRFYSDQIEAFPTDTERATQLVEEAKADGFDGTMEILCADNPPASDVALVAEGMWESVGFDVEVRTIGQSEQIGEVVQGNYDAACWGMNAGPATGITTFIRNLDSESNTNRMSYANPEMDQALVDLMGAATEEEQLAAVAEVNRIFNEDWVSLNYGAPEEGIVWKDGVRGLVPTGATMFLLDGASVEG